MAEIDGGSRGKWWYDPEVASGEYVPDLHEVNGESVDIGRARVELKDGWTPEVQMEAQDGLLYRGISAEEYRSIQDTGEIRSRGGYNFNNQEGLTYYSTSPKSAEQYAHSFAPVQHQAGVDNPAYVIAVRDPGTSVDIPGVAAHERGVPGALKASDIVEVHEGRPYFFGDGSIEVINDMSGLRDGSRFAPDVRVGWRKLEQAQFNPWTMR